GFIDAGSRKVGHWGQLLLKENAELGPIRTPDNPVQFVQTVRIYEQWKRSSEGGSGRSQCVRRGGTRERLSRCGARQRQQSIGPERSGAAARSPARSSPAQPHHAQRGADRGGRAAA